MVTRTQSSDIDWSTFPGSDGEPMAETTANAVQMVDLQWETTPAFAGFESRDGRMQPLPERPGGGIYSSLLRAELRPLAMEETEWRPGGMWLRVIDPRTGEPIPTADEEHNSLQAVRSELAMTRARAVALETQAAAMQGQLAEERERAAAMQEQLIREARAREATEERLARMEAALHEVQVLLTRQQDSEAPPPT